MVCSTDRSKAVVPVLVLLFVALWFILRGDLLYVFPCVILLVLRLPRLGKRELILVLFIRLFGLCLFRFVGFSSSWGLGRAAVCDCGTPWTFLLPFFSENYSEPALKVACMTRRGKTLKGLPLRKFEADRAQIAYSAFLTQTISDMQVDPPTRFPHSNTD